MKKFAVILALIIAACNPTTQSTGLGVYKGTNLKIDVIDEPAQKGLFSWVKSTVVINGEIIGEIVWDASKEQGNRGSGLLADPYMRASVKYDGKNLLVERVTDMTNIASRPITKYEFYLEEMLVGVVVAPI